MEIIRVMLIAGFICLADQLSKTAVNRELGRQRISLGPLLSLHVVAGPGGSKGINRGLIILWLMATISTLLLAKEGTLFQTPLSLLGLSIALGAAAGNLIDRWWRGHVLDFIDIHFWPVFNLADVALVLGLLLALFTIKWPVF